MCNLDSLDCRVNSNYQWNMGFRVVCHSEGHPEIVMAEVNVSPVYVHMRKQDELFAVFYFQCL